MQRPLPSPRHQTAILLQSAVQRGNLAEVQQLLKPTFAGTSTERSAIDGLGWNGLHMASHYGQLEIVQYLIETIGVHVEAVTHFGQTALHLASAQGHVPIVQYLVETARADLTARDHADATPVHVAAHQGGGGGGHDVVLQYYLYRACVSGLLDIVQYIHERTNVRVTAPIVDGSTPLHYACIHGHLTIVQYLIASAGASIRTTDRFGDCPLHDASRRGHLPVTRYLVEQHAADIAARNQNGSTPVHLAHDRGHDNLKHYFLDQACSLGHLHLVRFLLTTGGLSVNTTLPDGGTALHTASRHNQVPIVQYLVETCRANVFVKNNEGLTPGALARRQKQHAVTAYLESIMCVKSLE
jgi:ankyrin repeat protein